MHLSAGYASPPTTTPSRTRSLWDSRSDDHCYKWFVQCGLIVNNYYYKKKFALLERGLVSGAVFKSNTSRWMSANIRHGATNPGPGTYNPTVLDKRSYFYNIEGKWIWWFCVPVPCVHVCTTQHLVWIVFVLALKSTATEMSAWINYIP